MHLLQTLNFGPRILDEISNVQTHCVVFKLNDRTAHLNIFL